MRFRKYEGLGNDFIVVDTRAWSAEARDLVSPERARTLCDRHFGVGADGVLRLDPAPDADARMRVFNADGSEAEMCGNGLRCVARALSDGRERQGTVTVEVLTGAGRLSATVTSETVEADLGVARDDGRLTLDVDGEVVTGRALDLGNPHFVVDAPNGRDAAARLGPRLQHHPAFPRGVNVSCRVLDRNGVLVLHVWERGCGLTLACGTGAAATASAAWLDGLVPRGFARVRLPGGELTLIERAGRLAQRGPARLVYRGEIDD